MKNITLTHNTNGNDVLVNWDKVLFATKTENNFGEPYTELAFEKSGALPIKETPEEILSLINSK